MSGASLTAARAYEQARSEPRSGGQSRTFRRASRHSRRPAPRDSGTTALRWPHMAGPVVVILAAGHGTRMKSRVPKVLHDLCGKPLVRWPVDAALAAGARKVVVVGGPDRAIAPYLPDGATLAVQEEARGTGDAVLAAAPEIAPDDAVIVISGDVP